VRWQELTIEAEASRRLPGYRDPATIRTFDAPEALDTRFYEIAARSVLNRVPKASRMPFRWTINPYRGCSHACVYCLSGDTPILLADGRTRPLADLSVGDAIVGTERRGSYRRYVTTEVLDHFSSIKPAYRVTLEDGTELVASGDHRFLTRRGWKHVTGAEQGRLRRPHLTIGGDMLGTGAFATAPTHTEDYRRGYLCGMIRGDGHVGSYSYDRPGRTNGDVHRFRLALCDHEALCRTQEFLAEAEVPTQEFAFAAGTAAHRGMQALRTSARGKVERVRELIGWPLVLSGDWRKGFLAGIFDAEGGYSQGVLRISNTDPELLDMTARCLTHFGFDAVVEPPQGENGLRSVRFLGGLPEHLRFFQTFDPAITRKRTIEGRALKTKKRTRVVSVEALGMKLRLFDITTGTGDFIANGTVSHNCFARPTHTYLGLNAGRDFEREIVVKVNAPEVLRRELARPSWAREHVAIGTNTDPYQWVEGRYRLMPDIWAALLEAGTPCSVLTKSPLLLRDIEVMQRLHASVGFRANLSIPTMDEKVWRQSEPHTPHPRKRMEAVAELNRAGIPAGILIAPLMPGLNDGPGQVEAILEAAAEAGAVDAGGIALHLRGEVRGIFFDWLRATRPDLVTRYEAMYARGAYAPRDVRERLSERARGGGRGAGAMRDTGTALLDPAGGAVGAGERIRRPRGRSEAPPEDPEMTEAALF